MEQTFIMIKPDGVQRGMKLIRVECPFAEKHYEDLSSKPFFESLVEYIISGPVVAMVWEGKNVVATGWKIIGATNPSASDPGTMRGSFAVEIGRNVIHGSDSVGSAKKEIALQFPDGDRELAKQPSSLDLRVMAGYHSLFETYGPLSIRGL